MTVMTSGMAHISSALLVATRRSEETRHLLTAIPSHRTVLLAKMFVQRPASRRHSGLFVSIRRPGTSTIDAAGRANRRVSRRDQRHAMLISFVALVALINALLSWLGAWVYLPDLSLQKIFGWAFAPVAWCLGVPWKDAGAIGNLLGTRMALNEFIAYVQLGTMKASLDPRSFTIATFALCGFANIASIGIQIGGLGALIPDRRQELARLGMRAMIAGTLANFASACIAALLL
jgi:CNT family concentrative nucleoside transporter